ncbi:hypothetical protein B0H66DRAFT_394322 [Apodospora peruviana]|uniref:Kelch repeat protein n=1 Tax=Apodospora peruviana TaxID=516989 RepID=A0AAE0HSK3_9PEZI|nr:hypothetical protein B0H66DRAFT_394322 [Apodospora peruviana]
MRPLLRCGGALLPQLAVLLGLVLGPATAASRVDNPSPSSFLRRAYAQVTVLGDYVYITGGEVCQLVDGKPPPQNARESDPMNSTLSIKLTQSWFASNVGIRSTPRPTDDEDDLPMPMDNAGIWKSPDSKSFYQYGGITPYNNNYKKITKRGIWKFTSDGEGSGSWSLERASNPQTLSSLSLTTLGGYVATNTTGFWIGGHAEGVTDPDRFGKDGWVSGLVSYDMTTKTWKNDTANDLTPDGNSGGSKGVWVTKFGQNGLITFLGGKTLTDVSESAQDFSNITFFDPVTRKSFYQTTTGMAPTARKDFCAVTVETERGQDIFVYGGAHPKEDEAYDDVYVLSLPAFNWFKADDAYGGGRASHSCVVVGKRQMLSVGGTNNAGFSGFKTQWAEPDPFYQGLGIFDMTMMTWSREGKYNAYAEEYQSPDVVKAWYDNHGSDSVAWTSEEVKSLFAVVNDSNSTSKSDSHSQFTSLPELTVCSAPGSSTQDQDPSKKTSSSSSSSSTGAIAGGVVGGVGAVAIVAAIIFFVMRKKKRSKTNVAGELPASEYTGTPGTLHASPHSGMQQIYGHQQGQSPYQQYAVPPDQAAHQDPNKYYVGTQSHELPNSGYTNELPTQSNNVQRWELDSTPTTAGAGTSPGRI